MSTATPSTLHSGPRAALGFATYLGTSWTWVIGMLFPALVLRDYGLWGFVAFAVPNVVGAAAMGFVLTPERARSILEKHRTACAWFSMVTMAFHLFVVAWLLPALLGHWSVGIVVLTVGACLIAKKFWGVKGMWLASALVWGLSMAMFAKGTQTPGAWTGATWEIGRLGKPGLWAFIPASALGFALCPYLDLTFLKARAETEKNTGRWAFGLGFGVVFFAMIFFTVQYAHTLPLFEWKPYQVFVAAPWRGILMAHLPVQIGLTLAWHNLELAAPGVRNGKISLLAGIFCIIALLLGIMPCIDGCDGGSVPGEAAYRFFLLLYGTALPAYVLLKMIPTRAPVRERFKTWVFALAALLSYPLAWGVFVLNHPWLILPCAGVLTVAFLAVQFGPKAVAEAPTPKPEA